MSSENTTAPDGKPERLTLVSVPPRERDPIDERSISELAIGRHSALDDLAEERAAPGPVVLDGRDLRLEALEEFADGRNYLVWRIQQLEDRGPVHATGYERLALSRALSKLAAAFDLVNGGDEQGEHGDGLIECRCGRAFAVELDDVGRCERCRP